MASTLVFWSPSPCGEGDRGGRRLAPASKSPKPLWDSYFFPIGPFSKPYAGRAHISASIFDHPAAAALRRRRSCTLLDRRNHTMDIAVLAIGAVFFALAFAYVAVCDKL